jgi:hypothetical protein
VITDGSESSSELDNGVIAQLATEAGVVIRIRANECTVRSGDLAEMEGCFVVKASSETPATLVDQSGQDYGNGRVSVMVPLPITISFLRQHGEGFVLTFPLSFHYHSFSALDSKIIAEIQGWKAKIKRLHFLSENRNVLISPAGDVTGNLTESTLIGLLRSSQPDPDSMPKSKNLNCFAVWLQFFVT